MSESLEYQRLLKISPIKAFDYLMRNSVAILEGPDDPRVDEIAAYMRKQKARVDQGKKMKPSHSVDEAVFNLPPPLKRGAGFRRR
jgi:hypothetical protein